jgi:hypothetical protein
LKCHVAPDFDVKNPPLGAPYFKTDGVGCESCHGPARNWINEHHLDAWQLKSVEEKTLLGMNDTQSLLGRAQTCVQCHVGTPEMDVDHDLIAAGHPRLNFEFAAFHAGMPRHWPDAKDRAAPRGGPDFEARAWMIGQLVSAQAALELLAERASNQAKAWPEFAEHDCAACHHNLQPDRYAQKNGNRKPGAMAWGNYFVMSPIALNGFHTQDDSALQGRMTKFQIALAELHKTMDRSTIPDRKIVAKQARAAAELLKPLIIELNRKKPARAPLEKLFNDMLAMPDPKMPLSADAVTQLHLGLSATHQARRDLKMSLAPAELDKALRGLSLRLQLPARYDVAGSFNPEAVRKRISDFQK